MIVVRFKIRQAFQPGGAPFLAAFARSGIPKSNVQCLVIFIWDARSTPQEPALGGSDQRQGTPAPPVETMEKKFLSVEL